MSTEPTMGDVFRRAAEIIRSRGQAKGIGTAENGAVCLVIAVDEAAIPADLAYVGPLTDAWLAFRAANGLPAGLDCVTWNDKTATQAEVEKFFLFAADRADFPDGQS